MEEVSEGAEAEETSNVLLEEMETVAAAVEDDEGNVLRNRKGTSSARSRFTLSAGTLYPVEFNCLAALRLAGIAGIHIYIANFVNEASNMLRKKIPQSGILMLPRRLWMQTVPTQDCDVVIIFSPTCVEATVNWLVGRLKSRVPELVISMKSHLAVNSLVLYVTATMDGLVKGGEELKLSKKTKPEFGSGLRELSHVELNIFQGIEEPPTFFTSEERQSIVLHLLHSLRGIEGDQIAGIAFRFGQAIVPKFQNDGLIQQVLPLHEQQLLQRLRATWVQSFFRYQPLDLIQEYFGAKIGIYFSWLGFYTASLTVPALIGFFLWINFWGKDQAQEDKAFLILAFLNVVWGSMWLEAWKRRSSELTHRWGIHEPPHELLEDPSPHFIGELEVSPITGRLEPVYPAHKRNLFRYLVTLPVVLLCLSLVFVVMLIILKIQEWFDSVIEYRGLPALLSYIPKFVMAGTISAFDEGYNKIAVWLNDMENYRHEESYQNHLIVKLTIFRVVNSFLVLFYIAFYLQDMENLKAQLAALFLTRQIAGNIKESCIPFLLEQFKLARLSFDLFGAITPSTEASKWKVSAHKDANIESTKDEKQVNGATLYDKPLEVVGEMDESTILADKEVKKYESAVPEALPRMASRSRIVSQAEVESNMAKYDDTFEDYLEMFIQFGYVMLFSSAFPLAATCAFVNNLIEIRSDAFKLCFVFQRPFGQRVRSIGVWQDAMEFMCLLGIMVNCMLIGMSGQVHRMFPEMSTTQTILLIIVLEHAMIALKYGISYAIPDVPDSIAIAIAKAEFLRREALKRLSSSNSPPTREESGQSTPKSCLVSNLSSMEYIEKSVQTDTQITRSRKSSHELRASHEIKALKEFSASLNRRKGSADSKLESNPKVTVQIGRSTSVCEKDKLATIPKATKRLNQSCMDNSLFHDFVPRGPSPSESLPVLSAPAHFDNKKRLFNFVTDTDKVSSKLEYTPSPDKESDHSSHTKSTESMVSSTIKEESVHSGNLTETETLPEEDSYKSFPSAHKEGFQKEFHHVHEGDHHKSSHHVREGESTKGFVHLREEGHHKGSHHAREGSPLRTTEDDWRLPRQKHISDAHRARKAFPSLESLPVSSPVEPPHPSELTHPTSEEATAEALPTGEENTDPAKIIKKHPSKFLKRAQSFSQVFNFKRPEKEKKRKHMDTIRDDYSLSMSMEPLGELALVPLEKLVSIEDLRNRMSVNEEKQNII